MNRFSQCLVYLFLICSAFTAHAGRYLDSFDVVVQDYKVHYSLKQVVHTGYWIGAAGILANTGLDRGIRRIWLDDIQSSGTNKISKQAEKVGGAGQVSFMIPLYLAAWGLDAYSGTNRTQTIGLWGQSALRITLLMAPQQAVLTEVLGASRPPKSSHWHPFKDGRGVSGHAAYGAVPFLALAASLEEPWQRNAAIFLSMLPALERINDDKHYTSQALLGWGLSYTAYRSILSEDNPFRHWRIKVKRHGVYFSYKWPLG